MLEPIDDIKLQVQINTITMKQIKDMLTRESAEAAERDEKVDRLFKVIEDLRNDIMNKTAPESSFNHRPDTDIPQVKFEGAPALQIQSET